jgi:hypothetical protein
VIDELERLERAATRAPIGIDRDGEIFPLDEAGEFVIEGEIAAMCSDNPNDGPLFVAARNALPALLRVARAARELEEILATVAADADAADVLVMRRHAARAELRAALAALEGAPDA